MKSRVNQGKNPDLAAYRVDGSARTAGTVTANKGGYKIADTSTTAKVGMIYRAETGTAALIGVECMIIEANTNDFTIASKVAPTAADTFYLLRKVTPRAGSDGAFAISTTGLATDATLATLGKSSTATNSSLSYNAANQTALALNANRLGAKFYNSSNGDVVLKFGATATADDYIIYIAADGYYNLEQPVYTGRIDAIWVSGSSGKLRITELT